LSPDTLTQYPDLSFNSWAPDPDSGIANLQGTELAASVLVKPHWSGGIAIF